jgi:hypothetical protein
MRKLGRTFLDGWLYDSCVARGSTCDKMTYENECEALSADCFWKDSWTADYCKVVE